MISHYCGKLLYMTEMKSEEDSKPIYSFRSLEAWSNKLNNRRLPNILITDPNTIESRDSDSEPTITRSEQPLNTQHCAAYFQVGILGVTEEDQINIGVMAKDNSTKQYLGKSNHSFGYYKGDLFLNKRKVGTLGNEKLKAGDRIGIGVDCHSRCFFVTKNGDMAKESISVTMGWNEFYMGVGLTNEGQKVRVYFETIDFKFNLPQLIKTIQQSIDRQINKEEVPNTQIYSLVHEYLNFNGYSQTLGLLEEKQIEFPRLNRMTKIPGDTQPRISLQTPAKSSEMQDEDAQMNAPLKMRSRIMSEKIPFQQEFQVKRKNTEMMGMQREDPFVSRPSAVSNISNVSNLSNLSNPDEQGEEQRSNFFRIESERQVQPLNQNEKFLTIQKVEIVQLIKERKVEEALQIMQKFIPKIFSDEYLLAFMYAHIFISKVKNEGSKLAINFSSSQKNVLEPHMGTLFPFYDRENGIKWKPMRGIYSVLAYNTPNPSNSVVDLVSDNQFQFFSKFISGVILKEMGYLGCSRLSFMVHHLGKLTQKLEDYKGMTCGLNINV